MIHSEVSEIFKRWFIEQPQYKGWYLFPNPTGFASVEKVRYGMPTEGGGADWFSFGNGTAQFFEIKTDEYPYLSKKQKIFARNMTNQCFKCWVFRQKGDQFYLVDAVAYATNLISSDSLLNIHQNESKAPLI